MNPKKRRAIFETLQSLNPHPTTELEHESPFELLISVMLSAQATDVSVNKAMRRMYPVANTPAKVLALGEEGVTEFFFRQAVGRLVRWSGRDARQTAYMFIPDDLRLRTFATGIAEQRRHSLRRQQDAFGDEDEERRPRDVEPAEEAADSVEQEQLSLFTAISAVPFDEQGRRLDGVRVYDDGENDAIPDLVGATGEQRPSPAAEAAVVGSAPVPLPEPDSAADGDGRRENRKTSALQRRRQLREQRSDDAETTTTDQRGGR